MRKIIFVTLTIFVMALSHKVWGEDLKRVAILPFTIHSSEEIDYIRDGIMQMLTSRMTVEDKIEIIDRATVEDLTGKIKKKDYSQSDAYVMGKKLEAAYVVWGSIVKNGSAVSLEANLLDIEANEAPVNLSAQNQSLDQIVPKVSDFARRIDKQILGEVPSGFEAVTLAQALPSITADKPAQKMESSPLTYQPQVKEALRSKTGTITSVINPKFVVQPKVESGQESWTSQTIETGLVGMDIGDVDKDGKNEIVAIDNRNIYIYKKEGSSLNLIQKISGKSSSRYLSVDVADMDGSGAAQIFVSSIDNNGTPNSFILAYKDQNFVEVASDLKWLLRVVSISDKQVLLGQTLGKAGHTFETPIVELNWHDEEISIVRKMKIPVGLSLYNIAVGSLGNEGPTRIVVLESDHMSVYDETDKSLKKISGLFKPKELVWKSDEKFGKSKSNWSQFIDILLLKGGKKSQMVHAGVRMFFYDLMNQGRKDLMLATNSSEVVELEWSGTDFKEVWKSRKVTGSIMDMQIKDINGDGRNELVLAVIVNADPSSPKSMLISYPLNIKIPN